MVIRECPLECPMRSLLPEPSADLDDAGVAARYAVPDTGGRPHLRLNFVASADGAVTVHGLSEGLQTPGDNRVFTLLRDLTDVVLVGAGTIRLEGYGALRPGPERRARRREHGRAEVPVLAVVSGRLDLDPAAELFTAAPVRPVVITHEASPADRRAALAALAGRGLPRILCEGGPHLFGSLLVAGCTDELCLTLSPLLAGPGPGRIVAGPPLPAPVAVRLTHLLEEDGALFCRYAVG